MKVLVVLLLMLCTPCYATDRVLQHKFALAVSDIIMYAHSEGYQITLGSAYATTGHMDGSKHYRRLAIDLNLFKDGTYLKETKDHLILGLFWEKIGGTWGGRFGDGNHYEWPEDNE